MKIEYNNKTYELDMDTLIQNGLIKPLHNPITNIDVGDIFNGPRIGKVVIIQSEWNRDKYVFGGLFGCPFSIFSSIPMTAEQCITYLNNNKAVFVKNINDKMNFDN